MKDDIKKIIKIIKVVKIASICITVAATVYSLIPKYDKIEGVTEEGFLRNTELRADNTELITENAELSTEFAE